jgi:hypothetical protein
MGGNPSGAAQNWVWARRESGAEASPHRVAIGTFAGEGHWTSDVIRICASWQLAWQSAAEVLTIELRDADNLFVKLVGSEFAGGRPPRERTADATLWLLGGRPEHEEPVARQMGRARPPARSQRPNAKWSRASCGSATAPHGRLCRRGRIGWLDANASNTDIRRTLEEHGHARYLVSNGRLQELEGVA